MSGFLAVVILCSIVAAFVAHGKKLAGFSLYMICDYEADTEHYCLSKDGNLEIVTQSAASFKTRAAKLINATLGA